MKNLISRSVSERDVQTHSDNLEERNGKVNIWDIKGTEFPAGRRTRVILGQNGAMEGSKFCQGLCGGV